MPAAGWRDEGSRPSGTRVGDGGAEADQELVECGGDVNWLVHVAHPGVPQTIGLSAIMTDMGNKNFVSVNLTAEARDELRQAVLDLTSAVGRRISMSDVLLHALQVAKGHDVELVAALKADK